MAAKSTAVVDWLACVVRLAWFDWFVWFGLAGLVGLVVVPFFLVVVVHLLYTKIGRSALLQWGIRVPTHPTNQPVVVGISLLLLLIKAYSSTLTNLKQPAPTVTNLNCQVYLPTVVTTAPLSRRHRAEV